VKKIVNTLMKVFRGEEEGRASKEVKQMLGGEEGMEQEEEDEMK
jgi:hypothetical protein